MAAQRSLEDQDRNVVSNEKTRSALAKAQAEAKAALAHANAEKKARLKVEKALNEAQETLAAVQTVLEQERQERAKAEGALVEAEQALAAARAEIEQERQTSAKAEQAKAEAKEALAEAMKAMPVEVEREVLPPMNMEEAGAVQRVSFVVRLTIDERGQPKRTEVEHAQSGRKETFPALDVQRLADFMKACISPVVLLEPTTPAATTPTKVVAPAPELSSSEAGLNVSDVQVFRKEAPGIRALNFNADEGFVLHVRFHLQGSQSASLTSEESPFEVKVYVHEVTHGTSILLTTYQANLVQGILDYTAKMQAPGLSPGVYRLRTLVTLNEPINMAGFYEGLIFQVVPVHPAASPIARLEAPMTR